MSAASTVLVVQHEDSCPPGWLGATWEAAGVELDVRTPYRAQNPERELQIDPARHAALVVLGGEMNADEDDRYGWLTPTKTLLREAISSGLPTLGVCLGHQLIAVALGGVVRPNPAGRTVGRQPVGLTAAGGDDPLLHGLSERYVVQMNEDVVTATPPGSSVLAEAPDGSVQAVRFAERAWGVQFHPEAAPAIFDGWTIEKKHREWEPGVDPVALATDVRAHQDELRAVNDVIARRFLQQLAR